MYNLKTKLGKDGRIVIPAKLRKILKLKAGDDINIRVDNDELRLSSLAGALKKAQSSVRHYAKGRNLVDELIAMRREDSRKESHNE